MNNKEFIKENLEDLTELEQWEVFKKIVDHRFKVDWAKIPPNSSYEFILKETNYGKNQNFSSAPKGTTRKGKGNVKN